MQCSSLGRGFRRLGDFSAVMVFLGGQVTFGMFMKNIGSRLVSNYLKSDVTVGSIGADELVLGGNQIESRKNRKTRSDLDSVGEIP